MNQTFPDWMFAAIAVAAWSIGSWINRHWHYPPARVGAFIVIGVCALILLIRYAMRWFYRRRHPDVHDPDEWKQY